MWGSSMQDKRTYDDDYGSNKNANQKNKAVITDKNGNVVDRIEVDAGKDYSYTPVYKKEDGTWTNDPLDVARYSIDSTGAIQLTAPKSLYEVPEFHQIFDQDTLKSYSAAYRSNPAYRVPYTKRNEDGTTEETQITIPEFVEELNSALGNFIENYRVAEKNKKNLVTQYGDKASKLSLTQLSTISSANASANRVYLPDFIFNFQNSFAPLKSKRDEDGTVSVEDFMKYYKLGKTSDTELAGIMATIEGHLKGSEWGEDTVTFDDGTSMKNANSMTEAVRAMALKNFILSKDPDAEWYDSLGAGVATFSLNAAEGISRVFMNLGTFVEGIVTFGQSHIIQNATEELDKSMSDWNQDRMLIQDSTGTLATLGQIGGMVAGTVLEAYLMGKAGEGLSNFGKGLAGKAGVEVLKNADTEVAAEILTNAALSGKSYASAMATLAANTKNISLGARAMMSVLPVANRVAIAANTAKTFLNAHGALNWTTSFLLDTVHDAIFYDAVTLRHVIEGDSDQDVKNYWLGQLEDNAKWWIGTGFARTTFKMAGQTNFGQALNAKATQKIQGLIAKVGDTKKQIKDSIYGGDVIRHMEEIRDSLESGAKKDRLNKKIDIAKGEEVLRKERKALANLDLDWDGLKLTEESMQDFRNTLNNIKTWENAIDARAAGTTQKVQELVGQIKDPSTGRIVYVNPSLGVANAKAGNIYGKLMGYTQDYNLPKAAGSNLSQDIIDYLGGKAERLRKLPISQGDGPNAAAALKNIEQIDANLAAIKMRLPEKVLAYLDAPETLDSYFTFYRELRNYQDAKNLIDRGLLASYRGEGGELTDKYMPIVKAMDESDIVITRKSGTRARRLDESFEEFTYSVKENQHYVDPEIVRQRALWQVAEEEISQNLRKAYDNMSSATKVELASGETTERARDLGIKNKDLETTISIYADSYTQNWKLDTTPPKEKRKISKNMELSAADKNEIVATLSLDDTRQILQRYNVLTGGNLNLSSLVNTENYVEWFNSQPQTVKNYLLNTYDKIVPGAKKSILNGDINIEKRTELVKKIVKDSNGEKLFATRTQSDGIDAFHGSSGGTLAFLSDQERARWKGGRWIFIDSKPTDVWGYGNNKLVFPVNKSDILDGFTFSSYVDSAEDILALKAKNPTDAQKAAVSSLKQVYGEDLSKFPHYNELSKLDSRTLKRIADGDPRAVLDVSGKKIIKYDKSGGTVGGNKEFVVFPDRNPEILEAGISEMAEAYDGTGTSHSNNYELFKRAFQDGGDDFEAGLQRAWLAGDENVGKKGLMNQLLGDMLAGKDSFADGYIKLETRQALRNVLKLDTDPFVDSMYNSIKEATDDFVKNVTENPLVKRATQAIADGNENGAELASKYTALKYLNKKGKKDLADSVEEEIRKSLKGKGLKSDDVDLVVKRAQMMVDEYVKSELNDIRNALKTTNAALVDDNDMLKEVKKLHSQIYDSETGLTHAARKDMSSNIIVYRDEAGREVYAEVDPNFASLYKMRYQLSNKEASALAKFNAATSKLFRYGTTTLNLSSFSNQLFRDTGNALMLGGSWQTIKHNANNLVEVFGDDIVEQIKRFEPEYEMKQLTEYASMNKMNLQEAAVSREMARGAALSPATTETTLYKNVLRDLSTSPDGTIAGMNRKINNVLNKFASVDEWTNGRREEYLRKRVFANNLNRAMEQGYTLAQARSYATFAMNNATTNFTRQIYHMQAIADSTPYFRAAINGTKSFWRMWSIDPVGVSGRIMGGLILPTIFLTGASLGDPDNREVYKNIPEYQKDENLVFVVDKQIITIPIPQEMANIVSPFRQFVENIYYNDENSFWELMMNDALGFSPVDLQGFSTVDMDKMSKDPTIGDRISRGFARIFSQVAPVPVRSTYMMVTGTDPYTGKNLYDPSYTYWDDDTNSVQTMNENQNAFAKWVAKLWGKDSNATVLEKVTSSIFGSTGANALGELITLVEEGPEAAGGQFAEDIISQATNPYYANAYNEADAVWKRAVRALTAEKDQLTSSDEFKTIYSELSQTTDESKRKKLMAAGQNLINEYQNKVITTVERLSSVYKGTYDRKKFAATIQLLNFNTDPIYQTGTQYSSSIASDAFYEGREAAISTMQAMGVSGTSDLSIFGYLVTDDEGKSVMKYSTPVAIMDMKNAWMGAGDVDQANIEAKLKTDGIKTSDMWDGYYTAKAQGKVALKQYKSDWNAKVVKSLAPYISERGVDAVMKNSATRDLLDNYLFIDNLYQTKAYLKKIFENE